MTQQAGQFVQRQTFFDQTACVGITQRMGRNLALLRVDDLVLVAQIVQNLTQNLDALIHGNEGLGVVTATVQNFDKSR